MLASLREFFLLRRAEETARTNQARTPRMSALLEAAAARIRAADALSPDDALGALVLQREALRLLNEALGKPNLADLPAPRREAMEKALAALEPTDALAFDELTPAARLELRRGATELVAWLEGRDERRSVLEIKAVRVLRLAGAALAVVFVARMAFGALLSPPNRALHKPVVATSRWPDTPDPGGFTDGDRTSLGVHTKEEPAPVITVDLGAEYKVDRVRIYRRTDCCPDDVLPLVVEVGDESDPAPFVAERTTHFDVWEVDVGGKAASTVRVKTRRSPGYIALAELEVFGKR